MANGLLVRKFLKPVLRHLNDLKKISKVFLMTIFQKSLWSNWFYRNPPRCQNRKTLSSGRIQVYFGKFVWMAQEIRYLSGALGKQWFPRPEERKTILVAGILLMRFLLGRNPKRCRGSCFVLQMVKPGLKSLLRWRGKQLDALRAQDEAVRKATMGQRRVESIRPLSAIQGLWMVLNHIGVLDEFAASKTNEMIELLESGQGQRDN